MIGLTVAVATGLIEINDNNFRYFRKEVRRELRAYRCRLQPCGPVYRLTRKSSLGGHQRISELGRGDLTACCKAAIRHITPSDPSR